MSDRVLTVQNSGHIRLHRYGDSPDGNLFIVEAERQVPFSVRRVYFINSLGNPQAIRGNHAHRELWQAIFAINGSFVLTLDDGVRKDSLTLDDPGVGILIGPMLWHTMTKFSANCVILVLADHWYDEGDYIRDHEQFLSMVTPV